MENSVEDQSVFSVYEIDTIVVDLIESWTKILQGRCEKVKINLVKK